MKKEVTRIKRQNVSRRQSRLEATKQVLVVLSFTTSAARAHVRLDGSEVFFDEAGEAIRNVPADGRDHRLTWEVFGQRGDRYDLMIVKPRSMDFAVHEKLGVDGYDAGRHEFKVK